VLPLTALKVTAGGLTHPHNTSKIFPKVVHPESFRILKKWLPLATLVNMGLVWYVPALRLYSRPVPIGLVTVIVACPNPREQSNL